METQKILTLIEDGLSITINQLSLEGREFYFWFTGEYHEEIPKRGKGKLYPTFEALWDAFEFDPFLVFPDINHDLSEAVSNFLKVRFQEKKPDTVMNVFLVERWEEVLFYNSVESEFII